MNRAELKAKAKESLKGKYGDAVAIIIILAIIGCAVSTICNYAVPGNEQLFYLNGEVVKYASTSPVAGIVNLIVTSIFGFGYVSFFLKVSRNKEASINDLWSKANMFFPYLAVTILMGLIIGLGFILFIVPGVILALAYSMTYYIMLDNEKISIIEAMRKSREMMNGHKADLFVLILSFIGWAILGIFTFGILYFWLVPYYQVTLCNFYNELKKAQK